MKKLLFTGLLVLTSHVFAQSAATVLFTQKKVTAEHKGVQRSVARGSALNTGDQLMTSAGALVNFRYGNGALVNMGENSRYTILEYAPKANVQIKSELSKGKVEIKTPSHIKENLKTPIVSLAILGTDVRVYVASPQATYIQVIEGLVEARNTYIRPGDSVQVNKNKIISAPFPQEGVVISPAKAPGAITTSTSLAIEQILDGGSTEVISGNGSGQDIISIIATEFVAGSAATQSIDAVQSISFANILLACG
jgi:hypothetical protein